MLPQTRLAPSPPHHPVCDCPLQPGSGHRNLARGQGLVVFTGNSDIPGVKWLKPGFHHCFAVIRAESVRVTSTPHSQGLDHLGARPDNTTKSYEWIVYDPRAHQTDIGFFANLPEQDLAAYFDRLGFHFRFVSFRNAPVHVALWRPFTCVEAVKRLIGLKAPWVLTPWQLYQHLEEY